MWKYWNSPKPTEPHYSEHTVASFSITKCVMAQRQKLKIRGGWCASIKLHKDFLENTYQMTNTSRLILWHRMLNNEMFSELEWCFDRLFFNSLSPFAAIQQVLYVVSASVSFPHLQQSILKLSKPLERVKQTLTGQDGPFSLDKRSKRF